MSKVCVGCSRDLPLTEYHKCSHTKLKVQSRCRECVKAYRAEYYQKHQERLQKYSNDFYSENADYVKAYQRDYISKNALKVKERTKRYREANRDYLLAAKKIDWQKNRERYRANAKEWRKKHPEYARISCYNRRARLKNVPGRCSAAQWLAKCEYHGWRCYLCKTPLTFKELQMEHRKPISRGGSNWPANYAPSCAPCNLAKGNKTEAEFRSTMQPHP